jgi:hypothetical protein
MVASGTGSHARLGTLTTDKPLAIHPPGKDARSMKIHSHALIKSLALGAATTVRAWMSTLDYRVSYFDPTIDPVDPRYHGQKIYIFWHEYILFPIYLRGHCNLAMLLSQHTDAELLSHVAHHLGFEFVRGSSRRAGRAANWRKVRSTWRRSWAFRSCRWASVTIIRGDSTVGTALPFHGRILALAQSSAR